MEKSLEFEVDHTAITVKDIEKSSEWYGLFGFKTEKSYERKDLGFKGALLKLHDYRLELFEPYTPIPMEEFRSDLAQSIPHIGPQHIALRVRDLSRTYEYIKSQGVEIAVDLTTGQTAKYVFCKELRLFHVQVSGWRRLDWRGRYYRISEP